MCNLGVELLKDHASLFNMADEQHKHVRITLTYKRKYRTPAINAPILIGSERSCDESAKRHVDHKMNV